MKRNINVRSIGVYLMCNANYELIGFGLGVEKDFVFVILHLQGSTVRQEGGIW